MGRKTLPALRSSIKINPNLSNSRDYARKGKPEMRSYLSSMFVDNSEKDDVGNYTKGFHSSKYRPIDTLRLSGQSPSPTRHMQASSWYNKFRVMHQKSVQSNNSQRLLPVHEPLGSSIPTYKNIRLHAKSKVVLNPVI